MSNKGEPERNKMVNANILIMLRIKKDKNAIPSIIILFLILIFGVDKLSINKR